MRYIKITTDDDTTRWINLATVGRVTRSTETRTGHPIMVVIYPDGDEESDITIHGRSPENRDAIEQLSRALDDLAGS